MEVIVIDSDDDDDKVSVVVNDQKPAAAAAAAKRQNKKPANNGNTTIIDNCISLLDSSDDDENPGIISYNIHNKKRKRDNSSLSYTTTTTTTTTTEDSDYELAKQLQKEEELSSQRASSQDEESQMSTSKDGKAWMAVQEIITLIKDAKSKFMDKSLHNYCVEPVTVDDMVYMTTQILDKQEQFVQNKINGYIDTGYHYTKVQNMAKIRSHGLMTGKERSEKNVTSTIGGSFFGDGIYTANNGTNFKNFGEVGLIVCRLQGKAVRTTGRLNDTQLADVNTVIGDKGAMAGAAGFTTNGWPDDDQNHEIVLRSSTQCLPVVRFDRTLREKKKGKEMIRFIKFSLQQIMDRRFNVGHELVDIKDTPFVKPEPMRSLASATSAARGSRTRQQMAAANARRAAQTTSAFPSPARHGRRSRNRRGFRSTSSSGPMMPPSSSFAWPPSGPIFGGGGHLGSASSSSTQQTLQYTAPRNLSSGVPKSATTAPESSCNMTDECAICMDQLESRICVALKVCNHVFHTDCVQQAFKAKPQCPICRKSIGEPQGKSPSGTMSISTSPIKCSGFHAASFVISYNIQSAPQKSYHDNPGTRHNAKYETAYLPNNDDGKALLKRLKYAFMHGLTFTVGVSMTSGAPNCCTWASIHHKTSPSGGASAHGFPDPDYFVNCNGELNACGVPSAQSLDDSGQCIKVVSVI